MAKKDDKSTAASLPSGIDPTTSKPATNPLVTPSINPSAGKTIDERMADLLADHQRMGARPK